MAIEGSYYFVGRDIAFGCLPKEESSSEDVWADNKVYSLRVQKRGRGDRLLGDGALGGELPWRFCQIRLINWFCKNNPYSWVLNVWNGI
ncbi:hypothetical protein YC2023_087413 [Brassica napus]